MITGKVYSSNYPEGKLAVKLSETTDGWSLVLVITPPEPAFPGLNKEEHIFAGEVMVHEAKDADVLPDASVLGQLMHLIYIKND